ncbi:MAG TPA: nuclear transport factor 2 family protein [Bacteroidia bacterium]
MSRELVLEFIRHINAGNVEEIIKMMSADHIFTDGLGNSMDHEQMKNGWPAYLELFPDYRIEIDSLAVNGDTVLLAGRAGASYKGSGKEEDSWNIPAAWKAIVTGKYIKHWQVYCDSSAPFAILAKMK